MQMMVDPQEAAYIPKHMRPAVIEIEDLEGLRKLVDQLPDGTIYSIDLEEVISDGQEKE